MVRSLVIKFSIVFNLCLSTLLFAEDVPIIKSSVAQKETTVGSPVDFTFTVKGSSLRVKLPDSKIIFPEKIDKEKEKENPAENKVPLCEIIDLKLDESSTDGEKKYMIKVLYFRTGIQSMPKITIFDNDNIEVGYKIAEINVKALNENGQQVDIEAPLALKGNYNRLILLILATLLLGGVIFAIIWFFKKRKIKNTPVIVQEPPYEIFKRDIESLKLANIVESDPEKYIFELSSIFRKFIHLCMNINAQEMTDDEVIRSISDKLSVEKKTYVVELMLELRDVMSPWNYAKFAELIPPADVLEKNIISLDKVASKLASLGGHHAGI